MATVAKEFMDFCAEQSFYKQKGSILYSGQESLSQQGGLYFMGLNPGGSSKDAQSIEENLKRVLVNEGANFNVYWDDQWRTHGPSPLQTRVQYLLTQLCLEIGTGLNPKNTLCTNLIFFPTPQQKDIESIEGETHECWEVHRYLMEKTNPKLIVTYGLTPYLYMLQQDALAIEDKITAQQGALSIRHAVITLEGQRRLLIGLPHLSRYAIINSRKDVVKEMAVSNLKKVITAFKASTTV